MKTAQSKILLLSVFDLYFLPIIFFVVSVIYLSITKRHTEMLLLILSGSSFLFSVFLKFVYKIPRPKTFIKKHSLFANQYSFPSTHTMFYFVFFSMWSYLLVTRSLLSPLFTYMCLFISFFISTFIGVSRVAIGAHTVKDVIGGYAFGILLLGFLILLDILFFI